MNKNYVGENIKIYRQRKNLTQRELADKIGKTWEMISRYERGASSPLKQVNKIADVLNVGVEDLLKDPKNIKEHSFNRVPLFADIPKGMDFVGSKSYIYYVAPDWILSMDRDCFVIDSRLAKYNVKNLEKKGYLFISPNSEIEDGDIILYKDKDTVVVDTAGDLDVNDIIGKVVAQEIIFN
jgi:transcriptional regulator with XRE-family HTH domain